MRKPGVCMREKDLALCVRAFVQDAIGDLPPCMYNCMNNNNHHSVRRVSIEQAEPSEESTQEIFEKRLGEIIPTMPS